MNKKKTKFIKKKYIPTGTAWTEINFITALSRDGLVYKSHAYYGTGVTVQSDWIVANRFSNSGWFFFPPNRKTDGSFRVEMKKRGLIVRERPK